MTVYQKEKDASPFCPGRETHTEERANVKAELMYNARMADRFLWTKKPQRARYFQEKNLALCEKYGEPYGGEVIGERECLRECCKLISILLDMEAYDDALEAALEALNLGFEDEGEEYGILVDQLALCCLSLGKREEEMIGLLKDRILPFYQGVALGLMDGYLESRLEEFVESYRAVRNGRMGETPMYDVFLSYKSQDEALARNICEFLKKHGKKVFFSKDSLPELGRDDYEEAIYAALEGARHMVIVATDVAYLATPWVKAEWHFFNNEIREERKSGNILLVLGDEIAGEKGLLPAQLRQKERIKVSEMQERLLPYLG